MENDVTPKFTPENTAPINHAGWEVKKLSKVVASNFRKNNGQLLRDVCSESCLIRARNIFRPPCGAMLGQFHRLKALCLTPFITCTERDEFRTCGNRKRKPVSGKSCIRVFCGQSSSMWRMRRVQESAHNNCHSAPRNCSHSKLFCRKIHCTRSVEIPRRHAER